MSQLDFVAFCHFIADAFTTVSELSKSLQSNDVSVPQAIYQVNRALSEISDILQRPKPKGKLETFFNSLSDQLNGQNEDVSAMFQVNYCLTDYEYIMH